MSKLSAVTQIKSNSKLVK